jgi:uncharacterized protein YodC (DUF2158 family)
MADQIAVGAVVQLKSGGPHMTVDIVEQWNGAMRARCQWFVGQKNETGYFPLTSLKVVAEESESSVDYSPSEGGPQSWMR